jgi:hypothetical protein
MRKLIALCGILFLNSLVSASLPAVWAQTTSVSLRKLPNIREDTEAFPRVIPNAAVPPEIAAKINASLERFDMQVRKDWRDCQKEAHGNGDWSRSIQVTMSGPAYVSFLADETYDCANAHPEDIQTALVYDLRTGSPVNWSALLPPAAKGEVIRGAGRLSIGVVHWPAMLERAKKQSMKGDGGEDCGSAYEFPEAITFNVYLSATDHALALSPNLVPHIVSAMCSTVVLLKPEEAAKLGVAGSLVDALKTAR